MRNKNFFVQHTILNLLLVLAIGISVILTGFTFKSFGQAEAPSQAVAQQSDQQLLKVFRPTQYVVTQAGGQQNVILKTDAVNVKDIKNALTSADFSDAQTETVSTEQIEKVLRLKSSFTLRYPDVVPLAYFNMRYSQQVDLQSFNFNYFVLAMDNSHNGYFVNTQKRQIMSVKVNKLNNNKVWRWVNQLPKSAVVNFKTYQDQAMLRYTQPFKLPVYSYLVNRRDPKTYVSALLGTLNQLVISQSGDKTVYTNKLNHQTVTYDPDWETVTFEDHSTKNKLPKSYLDRLNLSFAQMNLLQLNLNDTRFYESQAGGQQVTYRTYVEGFPVYFQSESGAIHIDMAADGRQTSTYSLNELGVPVPNQQSDVTLPATDDVLKQLEAAGVKPSDYDFITPGYEWLISKESQAAVNMVPTWMIETSDGWQSVDGYLAKRTGQASPTN